VQGRQQRECQHLLLAELQLVQAVVLLHMMR
jgi:hypothetical protein